MPGAGTLIVKNVKDPEIQAVGIATPDFAHQEPFIAAAACAIL